MSGLLVILFFLVEEFFPCEFGKARLVAIATQKLSGTCLFALFLCRLMEWSVEPHERRCAA